MQEALLKLINNDHYDTLQDSDQSEHEEGELEKGLKADSLIR